MTHWIYQGITYKILVDSDDYMIIQSLKDESKVYIIRRNSEVIIPTHSFALICEGEKVNMTYLSKLSPGDKFKYNGKIYTKVNPNENQQFMMDDTYRVIPTCDIFVEKV